MRGDQYRLKQAVPQGASATGDGSLAAQRPTVLRHRRQADQRRSFFACKGAEFGKFGDQHRTGYRSDAGHGTEDPRGVRETPVATEKL